jgi:hypothetical protein
MMKAEILPPLTATVHIKPRGWKSGFRLWLPLFLFWLLLLPLVILALPFLFAAALVFGVRFWASFRGALAVLHAFHGASVEVEKADTSVFINLH